MGKSLTTDSWFFLRLILSNENIGNQKSRLQYDLMAVNVIFFVFFLHNVNAFDIFLIAVLVLTWGGQAALVMPSSCVCEAEILYLS